MKLTRILGSLVLCGVVVAGCNQSHCEHTGRPYDPVAQCLGPSEVIAEVPGDECVVADALSCLERTEKDGSKTAFWSSGLWGNEDVHECSEDLRAKVMAAPSCQ